MVLVNDVYVKSFLFMRRKIYLSYVRRVFIVFFKLLK